jgi:plasmid stability protein
MGRNIQIRNVPDEVHLTLRARASAAGQSLSAYLLAELTRVAERPQVADVLARAGARQGGASTDEIVAAVRSGRDRSGDEPVWTDQDAAASDAAARVRAAGIAFDRLPAEDQKAILRFARNFTHADEHGPGPDSGDVDKPDSARSA